MELYTNNIQDRYGNAIVGAQVLVLKDGGSAVIYSDNGVTPAANPLTTDADGEFRFYAASGKYDLTVTSPRLPEPIEFPGIALFDPDDINAELRDQLASTEENYGASMVGIQPYGSFSSTTVQGALEELDDGFASLTASDVAFAPAGTISATDVQAAIEELDDDVSGLAASDISFTPYGSISSTETQGAIEELDDEVASLAAGSRELDIVTISGNSATETADPTDAGKMHRFSGTGSKSLTFDSGDSWSAKQIVHVANRGASGNLTLIGTGVTLSPPKGGTLVLEPGDTVSVHFISGSAADVFGSTEDA